MSGAGILVIKHLISPKISFCDHAYIFPEYSDLAENQNVLQYVRFFTNLFFIYIFKIVLGIIEFMYITYE